MKRIFRQPVFWIVLILTMLLIGSSIYRLDQLEALNNKPQRTTPPMTVTGVHANVGPISEWISGEGTVIAVRKQNLIFEHSGKIITLGTGSDGMPLKEGSSVQGPEPGGKAGTLLAALDSRNIIEEVRFLQAEKAAAESELKMAESLFEQSLVSLNLAEKQLARSQSLFAKDSESRQSLELAEASNRNSAAEVQTARARVESTRARIRGIEARIEQADVSLEKSILHAPFGGVIARLNIQQGEHFDPSMVDYSSQASLQATAPITIIDPSEIEVTLNLPEFAGKKVHPGQNAVILPGSLEWYTNNTEQHADQSTAENTHVQKATVYSVSPVLGLNERTVRVKIRARTANSKLIHGMFVSCWIETEKKRNALLIPLDSLLIRDNAPHVFIDEDGFARRRTVTIGLSDEAAVEVLSGIHTGDVVITNGKERLYDTHPVQVTLNRAQKNEE